MINYREKDRGFSGFSDTSSASATISTSIKSDCLATITENCIIISNNIYLQPLEEVNKEDSE